ncbi:hypothetical protein ABZX40_40495 [Streptomyces sp. NPDC004610]|uniref:hypothetical protein n=1 Tax=unclassified Streptomyces TaxID=2593676 RepID=UPI00339E4E97
MSTWAWTYDVDHDGAQRSLAGTVDAPADAAPERILLALLSDIEEGLNLPVGLIGTGRFEVTKLD